MNKCSIDNYVDRYNEWIENLFQIGGDKSLDEHIPVASELIQNVSNIIVLFQMFWESSTQIWWEHQKVLDQRMFGTLLIWICEYLVLNPKILLGKQELLLTQCILILRCVLEIEPFSIDNILLGGFECSEKDQHGIIYFTALRNSSGGFETGKLVIIPNMK